MISLYTKNDRKLYATHLVDRFGSTASASQAIEEILHFCPVGSDANALMEIRYKINHNTYKNY